ncbi:MAG TPA: YciI family protein [Candidatus Dormibacteraeota bacterium]|jgi:uncharacterized protein YciI|nr:YciI family protein [Candidatus Dormibacteraeota bacterium]
MGHGRSGVPEVGFELDQFEVLILREGPRAAETDEATTKQLQAEHIQYQFGLQTTGKLLAAGAIQNRSGDQEITGLGFFQLGSVDEVRRLVEQDPSVKAGLDKAEVLVFLCPKGALAFPQATRPGA